MTPLLLPQLSISMEDGRVIRWLVTDGDEVVRGQLVVEVETDKATIEVEASDDGVVKIVAREGAIVPIDGVLAEIEGAADGRTDALPVDDRAAVAVVADSEPVPTTTAAPVDPRVGSAERGRVIASPAARRLATELNLGLEAVRGSGSSGRVVARDVVAASATPAESLPIAIPSSGLRDAVVRNIVASWQQIPHVHIGGELAADGLAVARTLLPPTTPKVTVTDLLAYALARALGEVAELNGTLRADGSVTCSEAVHLSLAVATPMGVVAPVLRDVGSRSLSDLAADRARLVAAARRGEIDRRELSGGTVTLSNLGAYPVDFFAPVVSGPQIAMIAVGRIVEKPAAENGRIAVRARMWVNVAIDHRAADGEAGGCLLASFERQIASLPECLA